MLNTLLATPGSNASLTNVYIDGFYQEPADVAILFGVRYFHHEPISQKNGRIAQHYKASLMKTFETHPVGGVRGGAIFHMYMYDYRYFFRTPSLLLF